MAIPIALSLSILYPSVAQAPPTPNSSKGPPSLGVGCAKSFTRAQFRQAVRQSLEHRPFTAKERRRVKHVKRCRKTQTRYVARRMRVHLNKSKRAYRRRQAVARVTPYQGPNGSRWSIPWAIVACESHGNFRAYNSGYEPHGPGSGPGGAYQIIRRTWQGNGGRGVARYASPAQQHIVASRIWHGAGRGQWACSA